MNYLKTIALGLIVLITTNLRSQDFKNYAILYTDDVENLLDTVIFYPNTSPTVGTLRCGAMENGKRKKGVKGKVVPSEHVKKAYFHGKTYISIPSESMKVSHLIHVLTFSDSDILVAADYGASLNVWVIDRNTFEWKTRQFALRNKGKEKDIDYNLKYFDKAMEGSFTDYSDVVKKLRNNLKNAKPLGDGFDYYKCGESKDLYDSLADKYKILGKKLIEKGKPSSYERGF